MHLDQLSGFQRQLHTAENGSLRAEGLAVHEVAPATHDLADQQPHHHQIGQGAQLEALAFCHDDRQDHHRNDRAVDGKAAIPDGHRLAPVEFPVGVPEQVKIEDHIVQSCSDDTAGNAPQDAVH